VVSERKTKQMYVIQWCDRNASEGNIERTYITGTAREAWELYYLILSNGLLGRKDYSDFSITNARTHGIWNGKDGLVGIASIG
jgi:hypothetical protein